MCGLALAVRIAMSLAVALGCASAFLVMLPGVREEFAKEAMILVFLVIEMLYLKLGSSTFEVC